MDPLDVALLVAAALATAYLVLLLGLRAVPPMRRAGAQLGYTLSAPFVSHLRHSGHARRFRELEAEIDRELGLEETTDDREQEEVIQAAMATQRIAVINRNLRKAAIQCNGAHWSIAEGLRAVEMFEAARHPLAAKLRQRVVDLSQMLGQELGNYPLLLDAPELVRLQVGIRWVPATCLGCVYFGSSVAAAPKICPTVKAMTHRSSKPGPSGDVIDGELVDDCNGESR